MNLFQSVTLSSVLMLAAVPLTAQTAASKPGEVDGLMKSWAKARLEHDTKFLESFYAKDLKINVTNGTAVDRNDDIAAFASGFINPKVIEDTEVAIKSYGAVITVTGIEHVEGSYGKATGARDMRFLAVLAKIDERLQLVAYQSTPIYKKP